MTGSGKAVNRWSLEDRVRAEFLEMPGLRLTLAQAARLWVVDRSMCESVLERLVSTGFLARTGEGFYFRVSAA
jgi:hypothetical protein